MATISRTRRLTLVLAATLSLAAGAALSGCSSGSGGSESASTAAGPARAPEDAADNGIDGIAMKGGVDGSGTPLVEQRAEISHGSVVLRSTDVSGARLDVRRIVDRYDGRVTGDQIDTDDEGRPVSARLVLRIPTADFTRAMDDLRGVAELAYASSDTKDVTTKVIDTRTRLRAQRASVHRVEQLLARAQNLRDIVLIESELSRRQADLESLEHQAAYLAGQTSMATINVEIEKKHHPPTRDHEDHTGFLAGLSAGWHGLTAVVVGLATALGVALPFAVALAAVAALAWPVRRLLHRRTPPTPSDAPSA